jgi:hypothetical protein
MFVLLEALLLLKPSDIGRMPYVNMFRCFQIAREFLTTHNQIRANHGHQPVLWDPSRVNAAAEGVRHLVLFHSVHVGSHNVL